MRDWHGQLHGAPDVVADVSRRPSVISRLARRIWHGRGRPSACFVPLAPPTTIAASRHRRSRRPARRSERSTPRDRSATDSAKAAAARCVAGPLAAAANSPPRLRICAGRRRVGHLNTERAIDRLVADAKAEDEPSVGSHRRPASQSWRRYRKPQIDIGDPAADLDALGGSPISCAAASASLLTSAQKIASKPASSAAAAAWRISPARHPAPR